MDKDTTIGELKEIVKSFCDERDWDQFHGPKDLTIALMTEAAELLEHFRFKTDEQIKDMFSNDKKRKEISEEVCDTLYFIIRFAQMNNIDLSTEFFSKMKKNAEKYPVEKAKGSNAKYNEL